MIANNNISRVNYLLSVAILAVFVGTQITEGVLFVPYWQKLDPQEFYQLHKVYGGKIHAFYAPITILATVIPICTSAYASISKHPGWKYSVCASLCAIGFLSTYFFYFKDANAGFASAAFSASELPAELKTWASWHWGRIIIEMLALVFSFLAAFQISDLRK